MTPVPDIPAEQLDDLEDRYAQVFGHPIPLMELTGDAETDVPAIEAAIRDRDETHIDALTPPGALT